jgi:hypothetical protein
VLCNLVDTASVSLSRPAADAARDASIALDPDLERALDDAATFQRHRAEDASAQLGRLRHDLPLPVIELPRLTTPAIGPLELDALARGISEGFASLGDVAS